MVKTCGLGIEELQLLLRSAQSDRDRLKSEINVLTTRIVAQANEIAERDAALASRDETIVSLHAIVNEWVQFVDMILGSASWRITRPLRFINRLVRSRSVSPKDRLRAPEVLGSRREGRSLPLPVEQGLESVVPSSGDPAIAKKPDPCRLDQTAQSNPHSVRPMHKMLESNILVRSETRQYDENSD
jgi:hypothetical protein